MSSDEPLPARAMSGLLRQRARLANVVEVTGAARLLWVGPLWSVFVRYDLYSWDASTPKAEGAAANGFERREVTTRDLDLLTSFNPLWGRRDLERRLAGGEEGVLWLDGERPAHCRWLAAGETYLPYLGLTVRPAEGWVLSVDAYTLPRYRRRGLYLAGIAWTCEEARRRGLRGVLFLVAVWNRPIRSRLEEIEAAPVGRIERLGLGPLSRFRARGRARRYGPRCFELGG